MNTLYQPEHFDKFMSTLNLKGILQYDYFVNWAKVLGNIEPIEKELNLLNTAVGKENIESVLSDIFKSYPNTIKAIPFLLAIREKSVDILIDKISYVHKNFNFRQSEFSDSDINSLVDFVMQSGLGELIKSKQIKSLPDYCTGVEVGLDSNGRKNRGGTQMEQLVESFVAIFCHENNLEYLAQANAKKIKDTWNINYDEVFTTIRFNSFNNCFKDGSPTVLKTIPPSILVIEVSDSSFHQTIVSHY